MSDLNIWTSYSFTVYPVPIYEDIRPVKDTLRKLAHAIFRDFFSAVKIENFVGKFLILFLFLLKT